MSFTLESLLYRHIPNLRVGAGQDNLTFSRTEARCGMKE